MSHEEVLNMILANTCASSSDYEGSKVFIYDLCCKKAVVVAKYVGNPFEQNHRYEIKSCNIIDDCTSPWDLKEVKELVGA